MEPLLSMKESFDDLYVSLGFASEEPRPITVFAGLRANLRCLDLLGIRLQPFRAREHNQNRSLEFG